MQISWVMGFERFRNCGAFILPSCPPFASASRQSHHFYWEAAHLQAGYNLVPFLPFLLFPFIPNQLPSSSTSARSLSHSFFSFPLSQAGFRSWWIWYQCESFLTHLLTVGLSLTQADLCVCCTSWFLLLSCSQTFMGSHYPLDWHPRPFTKWAWSLIAAPSPSSVWPLPPSSPQLLLTALKCCSGQSPNIMVAPAWDHTT